MNTYRLTVAPKSYHLGYFGPTPLAESMLLDAVEGLVMRALTSKTDGTYDVDVQLDGRNHAPALNELDNALQVAGYSIVKAGTPASGPPPAGGIPAGDGAVSAPGAALYDTPRPSARGRGV